jgi:hypothetical protein
MPETHFRFKDATQNKNDFTIRFGDRDFILAVSTCYIHKRGRFEVPPDFHLLMNDVIPFPVDGSIAEKM